MAWNMTAQMIETCSCNMLCPCWYGVKELMVMDQGWCASAIAFRVANGNSDGVDCSKLDVVLGVDFPGPTLFDPERSSDHVKHPARSGAWGSR